MTLTGDEVFKEMQVTSKVFPKSVILVPTPKTEPKVGFVSEGDWGTGEDWGSLYKPTKTTQEVDLSGLSKKQANTLKTNYMIGLLRNNIRNKCGTVNYNKYGKKTGESFGPVTDLFCDNFLLGVAVHPPFVTGSGSGDSDDEDDSPSKRPMYKHMGDTNKLVRKLLAKNGIPNPSDVSGIRIGAKVFGKDDPLASKIHLRDGVVGPYRIQCVKVAVPNVPLVDVNKFLDNKQARQAAGVVLLDVDYTVDHAGCFDRDEILEYLVSEKGFRLQKSMENDMFGGGYRHSMDDAPTILDNKHYVGNNCVTWISTVGGFTMRCKIYNKFVQTLETKSVRSAFGGHWRDWVTQEGTVLAGARDKAVESGLARVECTLYVSEERNPGAVFNASLLANKVNSAQDLFGSSVVYHTPYRDQWRAYTETMKHTLVVVDGDKDTAWFGYQHNELTDKVSGVEVSKYSTRSWWCLGNLSLGANLPVDVLTFKFDEENTTVCVEHEGIQKFWDGRTNNDKYGLSKTNKDDKRVLQTHLPYLEEPLAGSTRMVGHCGPYSSFDEKTGETNQQRLTRLGFVSTETCTMYLPTKKATGKSKSSWSFIGLHNIPTVCLPEQREKQRILSKRESLGSVSNLLHEDVDKLLTAELEYNTKKHAKKRCRSFWENMLGMGPKYRNTKCEKMTILSVGKTYRVRACTPTQTRYGRTWRVVLGENTEESHPQNETSYSVWANTALKNELDDTLDDGQDSKKAKVQYPEWLTLKVSGHGWFNGNKSVHVQIRDQRYYPEDHVVPESKPEENPEIPTTKPADRVPYKSLGDMCQEFSVGQTLVPKAKYRVPWFGEDRLVLRFADQAKDFVAGMYLESVENQLLVGCSIRVSKERRNPRTKKHYVEVVVIPQGHWWLRTPEKDLSSISKLDSDMRIVDTHKMDSGVTLVILVGDIVCKVRKGSALATTIQRVTEGE